MGSKKKRKKLAEDQVDVNPSHGFKMNNHGYPVPAAVYEKKRKI